MKHLILVFCIIFTSYHLSAQTPIKVNKAHNYIGENVTICDTIYSRTASHYTGLYMWHLGADKKGQRLIVQFDPAYVYSLPKQSNKIGKIICVTGKLSGTKDAPVIFVKDSVQISYQ